MLPTSDYDVSGGDKQVDVGDNHHVAGSGEYENGNSEAFGEHQDGPATGQAATQYSSLQSYEEGAAVGEATYEENGPAEVKGDEKEHATASDEVVAQYASHQPYAEGSTGGETPYSSTPPPDVTTPTYSSTEPPLPLSVCSGRSDNISCRLAESISNHILISMLLLVAVCIACYCRLRACCMRHHDKGEYRMVAAQYVDSAFDDNMSDPGDDYGSDDEEGSWTKRGEAGIEMNSIEKEVNGGLTLEEMNG